MRGGGGKVGQKRKVTIALFACVDIIVEYVKNKI